MSISQLIAAVALALAVGFAGGFYTNAKFAAADQVAELRNDAKQTATNVVESVKQSTALESAVIADGAEIDKIKTAAAGRVTKYQPKQESTNASTNPRPGVGLYGQQPADNVPQATGASDAQMACPAGGGLVLDVGTVRLLNAAREGRSLGATSVGNDQESSAAEAARNDAPSTIDLSVMVGDSLEITKMYRELAKRHDELVDAVMKKLQQQAE